MLDPSLVQILAILGLVLGVVLIIEWIFLPFAISRIKGKLAALVFEAERANRALATLTVELQAARAELRKPAEKPPMA